MSERAILVTPDFGERERLWGAEDAAAELVELSRSAGLEVEGSLVFRQRAPSPNCLIGKGKAEEVRASVERFGADVVVLQKDLTGSQQRNLEDLVGVKTIDRTQLILDIFAQRARSQEGKLQVELAQLNYLLPRLAGKGVLLSRLGGGVGTRGPGEQKLEVDRRRIRSRIARLKQDLAGLQARRLAGIARKRQQELPLIAIVGYTNAGKSRLFNALTGAGVEVKDKLFATLDTTTRVLELPGNARVFLSDTVGFISDLPHHLVEAFKATLEETLHADLLLHVIDSSRPDLQRLDLSVLSVLSDLGAGAHRMVRVLNKADLTPSGALADLTGPDRWPEAEIVSALTGAGLERLKTRIAQEVGRPRRLREYLIPSGQLRLAGLLYKEGQVVGREETARGTRLQAWTDDRLDSIVRSRLDPPRTAPQRDTP
ncbi:MAG: GTPase HflX [Candidatus Omnitrophica bacterium]|nr:GTPase HflX [Candidatus Omnitrophota bacterium]